VSQTGILVDGSTQMSSLSKQQTNEQIYLQMTRTDHVRWKNADTLVH